MDETVRLKVVWLVSVKISSYNVHFLRRLRRGDWVGWTTGASLKVHLYLKRLDILVRKVVYGGPRKVRR